MNRWAAVAPDKESGAWAGEVRLVTGRDAKTEPCGHLHDTSSEAMWCAQKTADRLNQERGVPAGAVPVQRMPPDYYLG
jgi:hypothetical protein